MNEIPQWLWPLLTLTCSALGSWAAVKISVTRLEVQMAQVLEDVKHIRLKLALHNDDLLVHDIELETALSKLEIQRVRRQSVRDR